MADISYLCLSDMHLGAENSLLTRLVPDPAHPKLLIADPHVASDVLVQLAACLRAVVSHNRPNHKPRLILNGDVLELALANVNTAAMVFERFMELTMKPGQELFDSTMYYVPGNHDHHLWEVARETQYMENYIAGVPWGGNLVAPWHATNMFLGNYKDVPSYFLNRLIVRMGYPEGKQPRVLTLYPNLGLLSRDKNKCVVFSHGHYLESIYELMTTVRSVLFPGNKVPGKIWDLEAENFAWIDFFWSTLGRSGEAGADVELIYDKMQDQKHFGKLLDNIARYINKQIRFPDILWIRGKLISQALKATLGKLAEREVKDTGQPLSQEAEAGLKVYLETLLRAQIADENGSPVPRDLTFIFGHTHKPFERSRDYQGYAGAVQLFNSGGWVVDSQSPTPIHGGAVIVVDEELNSASIRMYNETTDDRLPPSSPSVSSQLPNKLTTRLEGIIGRTPAWDAFTEAVHKTIPLQRKNLQMKIMQ
ncbi:MAG: metallophosphoesterase [Gammaproteobacteria bacterium]